MVVIWIWFPVKIKSILRWCSISCFRLNINSKTFISGVRSKVKISHFQCVRGAIQTHYVMLNIDSTLEIWIPTPPLLISTCGTKKLLKNTWKQHENMKSSNKRQLFISYEALYYSVNHVKNKIAVLKPAFINCEMTIW